LALRPDMVSLQTHLLKVLIKVLEDFLLTKTGTTEELLLKTLCNIQLHIYKRLLRGSFFCV